MPRTTHPLLLLRGSAAICLLLCVLLPSAHSAVYAQTPDRDLPLQGTIAYVRDNDETGDEIWLIEPDGSGNRRIWQVGKADPDNVFDLSDIDWRPDASEIIFASNHEFACSIFDSDLYAIRPDGSGYRRVTNGPDCASLEQYEKGAVSVTIRNQSTLGPFFVYVQGAPSVQIALVPQGGSTTVTFNDVADFGDGVFQQAVVIWGNDRWIAPIAGADVIPGQSVNAGWLDVSGTGIRNFGAYIPSWHRYGARIGYMLVATGDFYEVPRYPEAGSSGLPILNLDVDEIPSAGIMDWGPTPMLADQILYASYLNGGIFRVTEGSEEAGTLLVETGFDWVFDLQWLPDGTGFLYTRHVLFEDSNIYHYDFASKEITQLTDFDNEYVIDISISPDGQWVVFERSASSDMTNGDLWLMRIDGSEMRLFVEDAMRPSWSREEPRLPNVPLPSGRHPVTPR